MSCFVTVKKDWHETTMSVSAEEINLHMDTASDFSKSEADLYPASDPSQDEDIAW